MVCWPEIIYTAAKISYLPYMSNIVLVFVHTIPILGDKLLGVRRGFIIFLLQYIYGITAGAFLGTAPCATFTTVDIGLKLVVTWEGGRRD